MNRPLNLIITTILLIAIGATPGSAGLEGRLAGTILDPAGKPLEGVEVTCSEVEGTWQATRTSNKKGKFTLLVMDGTKTYLLRLEKDGYSAIEEPFEPQIGDTIRKSWTMEPGQGGSGSATAAVQTGVAPAEVTGQGQAGRLYRAGYESLQEGNLEKAMMQFEEVVELRPDLVEAHQAIAMIHAQQEAYPEALAEADKVLELLPGDPLALKIKLEAYRGMGDQAKQDELLDSLIAVGPGPDLAPVIFNSGVAMVQTRDLEGAAKRFEQAKLADPELLPAYAALAQVYYDQGRYEASIEQANYYLERDPSSGEVLGVLYLSYSQLGMTAEAAGVFEQLKTSTPGHMVRIFEQMGVAAFNNGQTAEAKDLLEKALALSPDHPQAHYHLALCYLSQGDTARAKELLARFIELAPDHPEAPSAQEMLNSL